MKEAEEEIVYEVIYKDENCRTEVENKTLRSSPPGRLDERESVRLDLVRGVKRRKRKLSKSAEQEVVQVVHWEEEKFESAQDLDQAGGVKRRKSKLTQSTEQEEVVLVVHGEEEKFESAQDLDQAGVVDPLLKTNITNESLPDHPDFKKKMKMGQSDADAPEKETTLSPPGRLREMIVALGMQEEMIAQMKKELKKIQQRKRKHEVRIVSMARVWF